MPTPPLRADDPSVQEALKIWDGLQKPRISVVAETMGLEWKAAKRRIDCGLAARALDPAVHIGMEAVGTGLTPAGMWIKTPKSKDGLSHSIYLKPSQAPDDILERIRGAFEGIETAKPVAPPRDVMADLNSIYPVCDIHANMRAVSANTKGDEYNLDLMADDVLMAFQKVMLRTPDSEEATLILNGDTLDTDNEAGTTPKSGHILHKDQTQYAAISKVVDVTRVVISLLLGKHKRLRIRVLPGNHDPTAHIAITMALLGYLSNEERVTVEADDYDLFMMQWGRSAVFAHHGDIPRKWSEFALSLSDYCPFWSETHHRVCFFGHGHNENKQDFGAITVEMLRPFAPSGAFAAKLKFRQRRALHSITFDRTDGIVTRALDPINRLTA